LALQNVFAQDEVLAGMTVLDFNTAAPMSQLEAEHRSRTSVEVEDVRARLHANAESFVRWLFSGRAFISKHEARIGDIYGTPGASLSIALTGADAGLWRDHATGEGGDLISLYMAFMGYKESKNFGLALKEIAAEFLGDPVKVERTWQKTAHERIEEKKQVLGTKPRDDLLELGAPVGTWKYFDTSGNVIASVVRYEPDGTPESKTYRPYCFKTIEGRTKWVMGAPTLRPLYRLPEIALASTVVLVEGEKCAAALASIGIEATSAMQGAEAPVEKTDWSPLNGKTVIVWPDNDEPGFRYGKNVAERLTAIGCRVTLICIPDGKPPKWDAADCVAEGGDAGALLSGSVPYAQDQKSKIRFLDIDEIENLKPPSWLVDGILTENGLSVLWGRSGAMKSFVALDIGLCVGTGLPWHGRAVKAGLVVYVAAEGAHGLGLRAVGWRRTRGSGLPKPKFKLVPHAIALSGEDLEPLVQGLLGFDEKPVLIIIDTLARTFGMGDENKQADMNAYVNAADRLREATGANIMVIHHSGVHEDRRERGSNVLRGAADTVIKVSRNDEKLQIINQAPEGKQKDAEEFATISLRPQKITYTQADAELTTLILTTDDGPVVSSEWARVSDAKLGKVEEAVLQAMREAAGPLGFTRLKLMTSANNGSLKRALDTLETKNLILKIEADDFQKSKSWRLI
jgi:hypothetical protein